MKLITKVTIEKSFPCTHKTAYMAPLCIVLAPVGALDGTRGRAVAQQVNDSCYKGVYTLTTPPH